MRARALLAAAVVVGASLTVAAAPSASAGCDPEYRPLCMNDCGRSTLPPTDLKGLRDWLIRVCPD